MKEAQRESTNLEKWPWQIASWNRAKSEAPKLKTRDWITVTGKIRIESNKLYRSQGPVIYVEKTEFAVPPKQEVATFY